MTYKTERARFNVVRVPLLRVHFSLPGDMNSIFTLRPSNSFVDAPKAVYDAVWNTCELKILQQDEGVTVNNPVTAENSQFCWITQIIG